MDTSFTYANKSTSTQPNTSATYLSPLPGSHTNFGANVGSLVFHGQSSKEPGLPAINIQAGYDSKAKKAYFVLHGCSIDVAERIATVIPKHLGKLKIIKRKDGTPELRILMACNESCIDAVKKRAEAMVASCHAIRMSVAEFGNAGADELVKELWTEQIKFSCEGGISVVLDRSLSPSKAASCFQALVKQDKLLPACILAETELKSYHHHTAYALSNETLERGVSWTDLDVHGNVSDRLIYLSLTERHYDAIRAAELLLRELAYGKVQPTQYLKDLVAAHLVKHRASHPEISLDRLYHAYGHSAAVQDWFMTHFPTSIPSHEGSGPDRFDCLKSEPGAKIEPDIMAMSAHFAPDQRLREACSKGDLEEVGKALESGANPNAKDELGNTALHDAATKCVMDRNPTLMQVLIGFGANPNAENSEGKTPLNIWNGT